MTSSGATPSELTISLRVSATAPVASSRSIVQRTLLASPSSFDTQALSIGSPLARRDEAAAGQPRPTTGEPLNSSNSRWVSGVPLRPGCATSSSGGGASPCATADTVLAMRERLPRAI